MALLRRSHRTCICGILKLGTFGVDLPRVDRQGSGANEHQHHDCN
jgi:hypothetical protein